jgi:hypothetical protein
MNRLEEAIQDALASVSSGPDVSELCARVRHRRRRRVTATLAIATIAVVVGVGVVSAATRNTSAPRVESSTTTRTDSAKTPVTSDRSFGGCRATEFDFGARVPIPAPGRYHWESPVLRSPEFNDPTKTPDFGLTYSYEGGTPVMTRQRNWKQTVSYRDGGWVASVDFTVDSIVGKPTMLFPRVLLEQSQCPA